MGSSILKANTMRALLFLALVLVACEARRHGHKGGKQLMGLIKVCELQTFCGANQFGPFVVPKGDTECRDLERMSKREAMEALDSDEDYECANGTLDVCVVCVNEDEDKTIVKSEERNPEIECEDDWRPRKPFCDEEEDSDREEGVRERERDRDGEGED